MTIEQNLEEVFEPKEWVGIKPAEVQTIDGIAVQIDVDQVDSSDIIRQKESIDVDFETSRRNLSELLVKAQEALQDAMILARSSEDPKAFQVVANIITQTAAINEQLMDLHLKKQQHMLKKSQPSTVSETGAPQQQLQQPSAGAVFIGSTSQLADYINKLTNKV